MDTDDAFRTYRNITYGHAMAGVIACALVIIGIQLFMVVYGFSLFLEMSPEKRRGRLPYMIINLAFFVLPTIGTLVVFNRYFNIWWDLQSPLEYGRRRATQMIWATHANNIIFKLTIWLGDSLMLYRCYVIWTDKIWVMAIPGLLYLATTALGIANTVLELKSVTTLNLSLWMAFISCSISLTVMTTSLIAGRLIYARRFMARALGVHFSDPRAGGDGSIAGASTILIESAVPLAVFGLMEIIMEELLAKSPLEHDAQYFIADCVVNVLYSAALVLSPQMIIFRVTTGRSWISNEAVRKTLTPTEINNGAIQHGDSLVFAKGGAGETFKSMAAEDEDEESGGSQGDDLFSPRRSGPSERDVDKMEKGTHC